MLAVQAQNLRCARLAIRARTSRLTVTDVDGRLNDGTLVIGWLNRGTLHLVRREDYWWLHALTTPPLFATNARRLAQTGVTAADAERGVALIERALDREGPLSRDQLRNRLEAEHVPTGGQALVHLLMLACLRGIAVRGPLVDGRHAYVLTGQWLDPPHSVDRQPALAELARRYLIGHAPATDRDLAKWAGLPLRDARVGLTEIQPALVERGDGLLELADTANDGAPRACLLDRWDPLLVGWQSREQLLAYYPRRDSPEAHYRPVAYLSGQAVALWSLRAGTAEWSRTLQRIGARPVGLDNSEARLARAREAGSDFPLVNASAESLPFEDARFDVVMCDWGATTFADPYLVVPEVARVLRPGGLFAFSNSSPLGWVCFDNESDTYPPRLVNDYFGLHRSDDPDGATEFNLTYGGWIAVFRRNGFAVEDLIEIQPPSGATSTYRNEAETEWARHWPMETIWKARKE